MDFKDTPTDSIIYHDKDLYVCLAHHPLTVGHTIVAWKADVEDIHLLSRADYLKLMSMVENIRDALLKTYNVDKVYLVYADELKHVHWHLVPRYDEKGLNILNHKAVEIKDFKDAAAIKENL